MTPEPAPPWDGTPMGNRMPSAALVLLEMSGVPSGDHGTKSWQIHVWATISHPNDRRRYSPKDAISDVGCHASFMSARIRGKTGKGVMVGRIGASSI